MLRSMAPVSRRYARTVHFFSSCSCGWIKSDLILTGFSPSLEMFARDVSISTQQVSLCIGNVEEDVRAFIERKLEQK